MKWAPQFWSPLSAKRARMSVRLLATGAIGLVSAAVLAPGASAQPARAAQRQSQPVLLEQSDWSTVDQPVDVTLAMAGMLPTDVVEVTVREPLGDQAGDRLADMVQRQLTGELGDRLGTLEFAPGPISTDGTFTITIPSTAFEQTAGVFPVGIDLRRAGESFGQLVTWVVRRPTTAPRAPLRVMLLSVHRSTPLTQTDGTFAATPEQLVELERIVALQRAAARSSLTSVVYPETLVGLAESTEKSHRALGKQLATALAKTDNLRTGYTNLHLGLWAANVDNPDLAISYATGFSEFERIVGQAPGTTVAPPDPSMTPQSVAALASGGIELFLIDPSLANVPFTTERPTRRLVQIETAPNVTHNGLIVDAELSKHLSAISNAAERVTFQAELAATALDGMDGQQDSSGEAAVIGVDSTTDPAQLKALTNALEAANGLVTLARPTDLLEPIRTAAPSPGQPDATATLALGNTPAAILGTLPERTLRLRQRLNAERMTFQNQDPFGPAADARLLAAITLGVSEEFRGTTLDSIETATSARLEQVSLAQQSSITATSRSAALPIQLRNDSEFAATVRIRFLSDRLALESGTWLEVVAQPGITTVEAPATIRSSGVFPVHTQLLTKDGSVVLDDRSIVVRSTAFSGVGIIVGAASLGCLVLWWIRTILRERRSKGNGQQRGAKQGATSDVAPPAGDTDNLT